MFEVFLVIIGLGNIFFAFMDFDIVSGFIGVFCLGAASLRQED